MAALPLDPSSLPVGRYWIGDLCYVMNGEWDEVCEMLREDRTGVLQLKDGRRFAIFGTMCGTSGNDNQGHHYPCDSGTIGCILTRDIRDPVTKAHLHKHGRIRRFHDTFVPRRESWIIYLADIEIDVGHQEWLYVNAKRKAEAEAEETSEAKRVKVE